MNLNSPETERKIYNNLVFCMISNLVFAYLLVYYIELILAFSFTFSFLHCFKIPNLRMSPRQQGIGIIFFTGKTVSGLSFICSLKYSLECSQEETSDSQIGQSTAVLRYRILRKNLWIGWKNSVAKN